MEEKVGREGREAERWGGRGGEGRGGGGVIGQETFTYIAISDCDMNRCVVMYMYISLLCVTAPT